MRFSARSIGGATAGRTRKHLLSFAVRIDQCPSIRGNWATRAGDACRSPRRSCRSRPPNYPRPVGHVLLCFRWSGICGMNRNSRGSDLFARDYRAGCARRTARAKVFIPSRGSGAAPPVAVVRLFLDGASKALGHGFHVFASKSVIRIGGRLRTAAGQETESLSKYFFKCTRFCEQELGKPPRLGRGGRHPDPGQWTA
jgi:hypothetical protein